MSEQSGDKSQEATPHRRQQAREKGQVAQSQDLGSAVLLIAGILILMQLGAGVLESFGRLFREQLGGDAWLVADRGFFFVQANRILDDVGMAVLPILGLMMATAVFANLMQVGFRFVPERIMPDLSRISPFSGVKRVFSLSGVMRLSFGLFKVLVVGAVAITSLYVKRTELLALAELPIPQIAVYLLEITLWTSLKIGFALLVLAILDYAYQRWKHEQDLRMTNQEVREELKNLQGDPQVIARRRQVQRQLVLNRLSDRVPKADVVITNPTELAIAIQYVPEEMAAPVLIAKGAGVIAQRIRRLALEHDIPIAEKKSLARQLYQDVEENHPVPLKFFAAIAEVLAYVYKLKGKEVPRPDAA